MQFTCVSLQHVLANCRGQLDAELCEDLCTGDGIAHGIDIRVINTACHFLELSDKMFGGLYSV